MKRNGTDKECPACGAFFYVQAYRADQALFCSMKCLWSGRKRRQKKEVMIKCEHCLQDYVVPAYREEKTRFCSHRCQRLACLPEIEGPRLEAIRRPRPKMSPAERIAKRAASNRRYSERNSDILKAKSRERYLRDRTNRKAKNKQWRIDNPGKVNAQNRENRLRRGDKIRADRQNHYRKNSARYKAQAVARKEHIRIATPPWADLGKIASIYAEAERLTKETGIPHHVDHFYPLRGKTMCGLHVEGNLQIIHAVANLRKSNRVEELGSGRAPALLFPCGENSI